MSFITKAVLVICLTICSGCAINANKHDELISKVVTPPEGQALIYIIRSSGHKSGGRSVPFIFNQEEIGKLRSEQYLYVFANPMVMLVPAMDGSVKKINIIANRIYYLLYGFEMSALDSFVSPVDFWSEPLHFKYLDENEARKLINSYNLSGEFRRVTIGASDAIVLRKNNHDKQAGQTTNSYESIYDNDTKKGSVTITGQKDLRGDAIKVIKDICIIKNLALSTSSISNETHASFLSLSETKVSNTLTMKFECLY